MPPFGRKIHAMIDSRLEQVLAAASAANEAAAEHRSISNETDPAQRHLDEKTLADTAGTQEDTDRTLTDIPAETAEEPAAGSAAGVNTASDAEMIQLAINANPAMAPIAEAARSEIRVGADGKITASPAMLAAMRAMVPTPDQSESRTIGGWLHHDTETAPVTGTLPFFTVSHWHWLSATNKVRRMPAELGLTFPQLLTSQAQIVHDLTAWGCLDESGQITDEAKGMFAAVTGHAELTVYGTVLLYAQRRPPSQVPEELRGFGMEAAVRDVPRVTFVIGVSEREVVCALVNNISVVFTRRLRRGGVAADAAAEVLDLLDPQDQWPGYPLAAPIVLPAAVVDQLAADPAASALIDSDPDENADNSVRASDRARREQARKAATSVLASAKTPSGARAAIAEIAGLTTHALAQITVKTAGSDVSRGVPGALALSFIRDKGVIASYPSGSGHMRRVTYVAGTQVGIENGIKALSSAYSGS